MAVVSGLRGLGLGVGLRSRLAAQSLWVRKGGGRRQVNGMAAAHENGTSGMTPLERFRFDTLGFVVIRGVLSPEEVETANQAITDNFARAVQREGAMRLTDGGALSGDGLGRHDLGGVLAWGGPVLRSILAHPRLIPYLHELVGHGYRLDHQPLCIAQNKGAEGFNLHGGPINEAGEWDPFLAYHFRHGTMHNQLLGCSVTLVDASAAEGGFGIIPGSHKSNFECPANVKSLAVGADMIQCPTLKAGDVVLFSEAATHGTLPWTADYQRRIVLYRFGPPNSAYGRNYSLEGYSEEDKLGMTEAQLAVLEPPYHTRLDRKQVRLGNGVEAVIPRPRSDGKKAFDKRIFGTTYF